MLPQNGRDEKALGMARKKQATAKDVNTKCVPGYGKSPALRRMTDLAVMPGRDDEDRRVAVPGRYVPVGFARYVSPVVSQLDYKVYRITGGWRVMIPRKAPSWAAFGLLQKVYKYGPGSAGFARVGDTLVPAILGPGDRMTLAQSAIAAEEYPLTL
jgi:hypothetical protein